MKLFVLLLYVISAASDDVWERDASSDVYIEASREGFEHVSLDCHSDTMEVTVHFDEPFEGILYTRGSYKVQREHSKRYLSPQRPYLYSIVVLGAL